MLDKKYHYVYEITNLMNGKTYIGVHSWKTQFDEQYYGSGTLIIRAIEKWTKDVFHVDIIEYFNSHEEALSKEAIIVNESFVARSDTYNLKVGGQGGGCSGEHNGMYGKHHSEKTKKIISEKNSGENNPLYGKHLPIETKRKISKANRGKIRTESMKEAMSKRMSGEKHPFFGKKRYKHSKVISGENNGMYGKHHSEETKMKMSKIKKNTTPWIKGKHHSEDTKNKLRRIVECPHCGKSGGLTGMKTWHFDNCRHRTKDVY